MILMFLKNMLPSGLVFHKGNMCQKVVWEVSGQKYGWFQKIFVLLHSSQAIATRLLA